MSTTVDTGVLQQAASRGTAIRLEAASTDGRAISHAARILRVLGDENGADGLWISLPDAPHALAVLAREKPACTVTLSVDNARYRFETTVVQRDQRLWVNDRVMYDALLLAPPSDLRQLQERTCERFPVAEKSGVRGQLFRPVESAPLAKPAKPAKSAKPAAATEDAAALHTTAEVLGATLNDLSEKGAGFICPAHRPLLATKPGDSMRCTIHFADACVSLPARVAAVVPISHRTVRVGLEFRLEGIDASAGAATLERAVAELRRQQSLRQKHHGTRA